MKSKIFYISAYIIALILILLSIYPSYVLLIKPKNINYRCIGYAFVKNSICISNNNKIQCRIELESQINSGYTWRITSVSDIVLPGDKICKFESLDDKKISKIGLCNRCN